MKQAAFLESLARKCYEQYGSNTHRLTILFPNRRAGLFFRKHLGNITDKPIWSPQTMSLEDFIVSQSDYALVEHLQSLFMLYSTYKHLLPQAEGFDKFYFWGEMILRDFNEIDSHLVNPEHIFTIVRSQKELDESFYFLEEEDQKAIKSFWSGFLPKASKTQSDFLAAWKILAALYTRFKEKLAAERLAYKGTIYRDIANKVGELNTSSDIWFAGFNALTKAEEVIIKHFVEKEGAEIFWDIDRYYLEDDYQEAGLFLRAYQKDKIFGKTFPAELPDQINAEINACSVSLHEGQVKAVGRQLAELASRSDFVEENTVIVLPDEHLLLPLLNSLPAAIDKVNVTMGFALKNSQYFSFLEALLTLSSERGEGYYFKHLLALLRHEVSRQYYKQEAEKMIRYIHEHNKVRLTFSEIASNYEGLAALLAPRSSMEAVLESFDELIQSFLNGNLSPIDRTMLLHLNIALRNIRNTASAYGISLEMDSFISIFRQLGSSVKVPFSGEPLSGIQIMGVLETRNLDFDHVFILSMNEGTFPADAGSSSFIPYNIRRAFDLPVMEHHDALQSYLFYRLMQKPASVNIFYNDISEYNHSGELSRFVKQFEFESGQSVRRKALVNPVKAASIKVIAVNKDEEVLAKLDEYLVAGDEQYTRLSPSALHTYIDCRLKFYFKYLEKIPEPTTVSEDVEPALFGNLLHHAMEYLYTPYAEGKNNGRVLASDFEWLQQQTQPAIDYSFSVNKLPELSEENQNGRSIIAARVLRRYIRSILTYDKHHAPFDIIGLEDREDAYTMNLPIAVNGQSKRAALEGIIDRIDRKGDAIRILDYKSGRDERKFSSIESLFDRKSSTRNKAVMQVLHYCLLYKAKHGDTDGVLLPGLFNSRDLFSKDFDVKLTHGGRQLEDFAEVEAEYAEALQGLVSEIFDPAVDFDQTEDTKKCAFCPYAGMCMRR